MNSGHRLAAIVAALVLASCGRFGIDLLDQPVSLRDGGEYDATDAALDAELARDATSVADTSVTNGERDGASTADARIAETGTPIGVDASTLCASGYASCDADPSTCETQLGTISNCARCGDVCPSSGGTPQCNANACSVACDLSGTWAAKITIQLSWQARVVAAGSGTSTVWLRFRGAQSGGDLSGSLLLCGITLPDFALQPQVASELYRLTLPNTLFDQQPPYIPEMPATLRAASGFTTGGSIMLLDAATLVGASLTNPLTAAWPSVAALTATDMDRDTKPGVTASYSNGGGYVYPRIDFSGSQRTDLAYVAARLRLRAMGTLPSCTATNLVPTVTSLDTHVVGCRIAPAAADCSTSQRDIADMGSAVYEPGVASMSMIKVAEGASCAQVRAAFP